MLTNFLMGKQNAIYHKMKYYLETKGISNDICYNMMNPKNTMVSERSQL